MNQEISLQDLAPSTLVDGAPLDISKEDEPDFTRQGSSSFNSLPMQENQSPKGGDHQTPEFDGNIDLSFLGDEEGNVIGGTSDSSVAAANVPDLQRFDFQPSSFSTPLMGVSASAFPAMSNSVQSASSTFDPLHEDSTNEEQTRSSLVNPASPFPAQMEMIPANEMVPPFSVGNDVNWTPNQFNSQSQDVPFQSEVFLPPPVLPFNQGSILCNDQVGQNMVDVNVINNGIRRTTQFPTSFPQNMTTTGILEGTPSWINQNEPDWLLPNHNTLQGPITPSRYQPNQFMGANLFDSQYCTNPMLPGSSMPLWPQQLPTQSRFSDQVPGMLSGPQPPVNQWPQQLPYLFNQLPITPNVYDPQGSTMFPESPLTLRSPQFPSHNLQVSGEDDVLINSQCYNSTLFGPTEFSWHRNSFSHQSHPGDVYMTQNATQHGGFNQSAPSCLAPWIQYFSNQVQVNRGAVMPGIDSMQKENFVPWNLGNSSSRSQMDTLQVQGMLSQTARPNAQQKNKGKRAKASSLHPEMVPTQNDHNESMILGSGGRGNSHFNIGESSSSKLPRTEWSPCHDDQESSNVSSSGSRLV
ncbi:hypothetical protein OIU85_018002 [Salix viminalis]|uniref:Uncharacterized protein n=1 Tax=Salix viminalis TaxID=40686 RepID=A0A9Q0UST2_SALVM|nr:hypothetical protein OIU85_018002 [Salix viminalis]